MQSSEWSLSFDTSLSISRTPSYVTQQDAVLGQKFEFENDGLKFDQNLDDEHLIPIPDKLILKQKSDHQSVQSNKPTTSYAVMDFLTFMDQ